MMLYKKSPDHPLETQCSSFQKNQSIPVQTSTGMGLAAEDFTAFDLKSMCITQVILLSTIGIRRHTVQISC